MQRRRLSLLRLAGLALLPVTVFFLQAGEAKAQTCADPLASVSTLRPEIRADLDLDTLRRFYASAPGICVWRPEDATALIATLGAAPEQGLDPSPFHLGEIERLSHSPDSAVAGMRDLLLTDAALRYARDMTRGRVDPAHVDEDVDFEIYPVDPVFDLRSVLRRGDVAGWLKSLPPRQPEYAALKALLARYRDFSAHGDWAKLDAPAKAVKPGKASPLVPLLRARLAAEGYLAGTQTQNELLNEVLTGDTLEALKRFQADHGLAVDGALGKKTAEALNVGPAERVRQIALNLERWRQFSRGIPATRIEVNTAAATAALVVADKRVLEMRAVVGKKETPTPLVRSDLRTVVIDPPWIVPVSIIRKEILPALKRKPDYLEKNNMQWQGNQLVQAPGEKNSLGRIKFEFPSSFDVYLHDTPARSLFAREARDDRARSHGCIRLEKPLDLAEILLKDNGDWPRERIEQAIAEGGTVRVPVATEIPVVVAYWTAFADQDGRAEFRDDIYGRDARLLDALTRRSGVAPASAPAAAPFCGS